MQTPAPSNSCKRRRFDQYSFELEGEACQTVSKKRKAVQVPDSQQPETHQDNSSAIPLERRALKALNQRNTQAARVSRAKRQVRRPATRIAVAEWKECHRPLEPAHIYLENCGHQRYKALQSFSTRGGPDLRDLRGVRISNASPLLALITPLVPESGPAYKQPDGFEPSQFYEQVTKSPLYY